MGKIISITNKDGSVGVRITSRSKLLNNGVLRFTVFKNDNPATGDYGLELTEREVLWLADALESQNLEAWFPLNSSFRSLNITPYDESFEDEEMAGGSVLCLTTAAITEETFGYAETYSNMCFTMEEQSDLAVTLAKLKLILHFDTEQMTPPDISRLLHVTWYNKMCETENQENALFGEMFLRVLSDISQVLGVELTFISKYVDQLSGKNRVDSHGRDLTGQKIKIADGLRHVVEFFDVLLDSIDVEY